MKIEKTKQEKELEVIENYKYETGVKTDNLKLVERIAQSKVDEINSFMTNNSQFI